MRRKFVKILPVYKNKEDRNLDFLSTIYTDKESIVSYLREILAEEFLSDEVIKGKRILIKPNWVTHSSIDTDEICLRTNDQFVLSALELVLEKSPEEVIIGDAPIQGCNWMKMINMNFYQQIEQLSVKAGIPISIKDFRRVTFDPRLNNPQRELHPISEYIIFDVGADSWLEPISNNTKKPFRVTCYDPRKLAETHREGMHIYCVTKEVFEADVVLSMPKIKTHQKTGITCALKNLVGLNGDKDYLPHHRVGGIKSGGDCYPGGSLLRRGAECFEDYANKNQGNKRYWVGHKASNFLWKLSMPDDVHQKAAGWYGNDTCWRMVLDLNKIVYYGKKDGTISKEPQRELYSLCDGIVGGQGNGPLQPKPLPLGVISFTNSTALNDICIATLMGFDYNRISLLQAASGCIANENKEIFYNNNKIDLNDLHNFSISTLPPSGWVNYLKK